MAFLSFDSSLMWWIWFHQSAQSRVLFAPPGPRMFSSTQEMMRRKAEQAELQQALEFQRRRLVNLQLPDLDSESFHHHQRSLSIGSPLHYPSRVNQSMLFRSENAGEEGLFLSLLQWNLALHISLLYSVIHHLPSSPDSGHFHSDSENKNSQEGGYVNHFNTGYA